MRIVVGTTGLLAGVLLCAVVIAIAIQRFRKGNDARDLLASLAAAAVAVVSGGNAIHRHI